MTPARGRGRGRGSRGRGRGAAAAGPGRGRGGARGRGGRGRGGRGRGRGRADRQTSHQSDPQMDVENFDVTSADGKNLFLSSMSVEVHRKAQEQNKYRYLALLAALQKNGADVSLAAKARALAAAWSRHDKELADGFLKDRSNFGVVEVLKAVTTLDAGRKAREYEKRMARFKQAAATAGKKGKSRLGRRINDMKKTVNNLSALKPTVGTVSGALLRHIKRWTRTIRAEELEFYALHLPKETWTQLADVCHFHPEKDFPSLPWFLRSRYDPSAAPDGSLVKQCNGMNETNVNEMVKNMQVPYAHLKQFSASLNNESKSKIAEYTPDLDTVLWHYEDLACIETDKVIETRLINGEQVTLPYGKFMERLLLMKKRNMQNAANVQFYPRLMPYAERMLLDVKVSLESPVVVIGDASGSMEVAIETSTIVASFLRALTNAQLVFFSNDVIEPPFLPTTIEKVLELATTVKTVASTCHASALWPYYKKKQVVKTFIVTTDEEENANYDGDNGESYNFRSLFKLYHKEVYPSRLVFVSFLHSQHAEGQMVGPLKQDGYDVLQFKLDHARPDLTKLNNLVGQLALGSQDFDTQVTELETQLRNEGLQSAFEKLNSKLSV